MCRFSMCRFSVGRFVSKTKRPPPATAATAAAKKEIQEYSFPPYKPSSLQDQLRLLSTKQYTLGSTKHL